MDNTDESCIYVNKCIESIHNCSSMKKKIEESYDRTRALEESKKILALINSPICRPHHDVQITSNIVLSTCYFCKILIPLSTNNQCKLCCQNFCLTHRVDIRHNCEKLSKDTAKYLNAKNQFKLKLREVKSKAVR